MTFVVVPDPTPRRNVPLIAMVIVGSILFVVGIIWGLIGYSQIPDPRAIADAVLGTVLSFWGGVLLILAWMVAAIRWGSQG